ncbi:MAG: helix-turn-helix domain-containing protein [Opitutales bacterium]
MKYHRLFRRMREEHGLSIEALATQAHCHRNTVLNVEKGRPVKFKTIATLMGRMGYAPHSPEMAGMALLWIENMSGVPLSTPPQLKGARRHLGVLGARSEEASRQLLTGIHDAGLDVPEIELLGFAARYPHVLRILADVQELMSTKSDG